MFAKAEFYLCGTLTRDPELKLLPSGNKVAEFGVAVNHRFKKGNDWAEEVSYYDCVCFGGAGEKLGEYMKKGMQIVADGNLRQERWKDKDGGHRSKVKLIVNNWGCIKKAKELTGEEPSGEVSAEAAMGVGVEDDCPI